MSPAGGRTTRRYTSSSFAIEASILEADLETPAPPEGTDQILLRTSDGYVSRAAPSGNQT